MDIENIVEIKENSTQLLSAKNSEPTTPERSPLKKQAWRKKEETPTK
jgi:hypothetical protein